MNTAEACCEEELGYTVSFRQARRVEREDAPPPGRFETTSRARLARETRYRRTGGGTGSGIHQRGRAKARR